TTVMNAYDVGTPTFIFIMGLVMPLSYANRSKRDGKLKAIRHILIRYTILLAIGAVIIFLGGEFTKEKEGMTIVVWDVVPSLGLVGFIGLPAVLLFKNILVRAAFGLGLGLFYQIMLLNTYWKEYAIQSVHGGIFGTIFGFGCVIVLGTCFGELLLANGVRRERDEKSPTPQLRHFSKNQCLIGAAIAGAVLFAVGIFLVLAFPTGWYPNKRQVTFSYILISTGASALMMFPFVYLERLVSGHLLLLDSVGQSPFLVYMVAVIVEYVLDDILEIEFVWWSRILILTIVFGGAVLLDLSGKIFKI
ncbi:hypothetical protein KIPB_003426, partial [Kipferlia bialata]